MSRVGWLLDCNVDWEKQALTLWIKEKGKTRGYTYRGFNPSVFVSTTLTESNDWTDTGILRAVREHPRVVDTAIVNKFASVYDKEMTPVLQVYTTPDSLREVAGDLEKLPGAVVYHADIDPVQQFFIDRTLFAFGRVEFKLKGDNEVTEIWSLQERDDPEYDIPELEELGFEVFVDTDQIFPKLEDRIHHIELYYKDETIRIEDREEQSILIRFQSLIDRIDPDVIVTGRGDESLFRYLSLRAKVNGIQLRLSRDGSPLKVVHREAQSFWQYNRIVFKSGTQVTLNGRIHIDRGKTGMHLYSPTGLEGVVESSRLALSRPQRVSRMTIGGVNAAVQYYKAFKMDILIPPVKRNPEFLKSVTELTAIDRGGLIFQPRPDIYEDIAECDFSSMYPTLMVKQNISPETICMLKSCPYNYEHCIEIPQQSFKICTRKRGIVSESLKLLVDRRMAFKKLIEGGQDAKKYEFIQNTLKGVLVSCFGYLGFKNAKFGRVEAHTAVTALSREVMLKTQDIGEEMGLEMIHGIVDSVWLKAHGEIEYENVRDFCKRVTEEVDIKMSPKGVYRWMVIPSSRLHPSVAPLNRYYGVYKNGGIKTRGIETRRRDTCLYVGDCQKEMIKTLARGYDKAGFLKQIPEAFEVCQEYIGKLHDDDVDLRDLILNSTLTRNPHEYRATSRAAVVAQQLVKAGRELNAGQKVRYVMTSADSENPLRRVRALELFDESTRYDSKAYATLCERAFENLIPAQYLESTERDSEQTVLVPNV
ncbi:MAG: DNA polymerase domain-containing protein [Candidatus Thorarchaeota archaeon]|jgi:DNA polymerase elongation subunit (family B)